MSINVILRASCGVLLFVSCGVALAHSLNDERVAIIDAHALAAPETEEGSPSQLAKYLSQPARDDLEKARAIFRWVSDRISYDVDAYLANQQTETSAQEVLNQRSSICDGYSTLFEKLARELGMEVVTIKGFAKGYGHTTKTRFSQPNHAWNAIKIDGQWRLVDPTWGAGYVRDGKYVKALSETNFLAQPEQFAFSHFPIDDSWQLQATPRLSKAQFETMPALEPSFFHLGIPGENVWRELSEPGFNGDFVRTYDNPYRLAVVQQAPLSYRLPLNQAWQFKIQSGSFEQMAIVLNDKWTMLSKDADIFTVNMTPHDSGDMMVVGRKPGTPNFTTILGYLVKP